MLKITPHLWFDKEAREAAEFYSSVFPNSKIKDTTTLHNTPSGTVDVVTIDLLGQEFMLLSAGPLFKFNEAISFVVHCDTQEEIEGLNNAKKYVASRTLTRLDWGPSEIISGDVAGKVQKLKDRDGPEIQVHGSGHLIQTLLKNGLVDEIRLKIFPITLGPGKRLFGEGTIPAGFELLESAHSPAGVIVATYARAGDVKTGSFALEVPTEAELARR